MGDNQRDYLAIRFFLPFCYTRSYLRYLDVTQHYRRLWLRILRSHSSSTHYGAPILLSQSGSGLIYLSFQTSTPADLLHAMSTCGFIHLSLDGTPLSMKDVHHAFSLSKKLFDELPLSARASCPQDVDYNGHTPLGLSKLTAEHGQKLPDHKEGFEFGRYEPPRTSMSSTRFFSKVWFGN